jgi:hypothetical protein
MRRLRFLKDWDFRDLMSRENCVLCKVMGIRAFKASSNPILVSEDAARAALAAGVAEEVRQ